MTTINTATTTPVVTTARRTGGDDAGAAAPATTPAATPTPGVAGDQVQISDAAKAGNAEAQDGEKKMTPEEEEAHWAAVQEKLDMNRCWGRLMEALFEEEKKRK